ncbi:CpsD/CapB family tyrosine-protein kinase [Halalkalibacter hemicellulosilyticus]|uniref:non-specific protein-tyrosine kinase n=1 Tax=Halalkalibacter hemicellulosilyticusJCM 9152 TaxID=1236971 RepID=W4QHF1_9BACI|nr:CpsD/CapB family tyrosine-protein kinase [Halalkalibacter hemicellulosilyticus]GAE31342.1 tyrosine-protein kinase EpsD [Halalkalibacter hemicellulosilyticusJCM 9152]
MARTNRPSKVNNERNLIAETDKRSPIAEQYRTIRTNIEFSAVDEELRTLAVTSSGPGEGKSTTAANLAIVMAQNGSRVLLVDADLRKPTMHYTFKTINSRGLTNVLTKQDELEEACQQTKIENLTILTSGPIPPNPSELLNSKMMEITLRQATEMFDVVLLDTPPVMAVADPQIIASKVNGTIIVTSSGKTDKEQLTRTKDLLTKAKARLLGVVLNNKEVNEGQYYYYANQ